MNTPIFIRIVLLIGALTSFCAPLYAQSLPKHQYDDVVFYFPLGSSTFDISYMSNKSSFDKAGRLFLASNLFKIKRLIIAGSVSADDDSRAGLNLAHNRAQAVCKAILKKYPWVFVDDRMPISIETLAVEASFQDGATSYLRSATLYAVYEDQPIVTAPLLADHSLSTSDKRIEPATHQFLQQPSIQPLVAVEPLAHRNATASSNNSYQTHHWENKQIPPSGRFKPKVALKTNMLFDLALVVNFEAELLVADRLSFSASVICPRWHFDNRVCVSLTEVAIEGRHWFSSEPFSGHFVGVYANWIADYDLQWKQKGVMGHGFGAGITYGYAHTIAPNWGLEYSVGLGALYLENKSFNVVDDYGYKVLERVSNSWSILPTRLKVSLVWRIAGDK